MRPCLQAGGVHDVARLAGVDHDPPQREAADEDEQRGHDGVGNPVSEFEALQRHRHEDAERDDHAPERPCVRAR